MTTHNANSMILEADAPLSTEYSVFQVESVWHNQSGDELQLSELTGRVQVVAMTFTSCEVSCPRIVAAMKRIEKESDARIGLTLISIDPERDSPTKLMTYATKMDLDGASWSLLQGELDDVREMAALLGVRFKKMEDGDFAHSNIISVLDTNGVILHQQNGISDDLTRETVLFVQDHLAPINH